VASAGAAAERAVPIADRRLPCYDPRVNGAGQPTVSIVIPCYNEEVNLQAGCLAQVGAYAQQEGDILEVLVVDDGSADRSRDLVAALAVTNRKLRLLAEPHRGKAGAVIAGILAARATYVLFTDMDQATPIGELDKLRPYFQQNYDVVVGSRQGRRAGAPLVRRLMATGFIMLRRLILDLGGVTDTQCGFKSLRTDMARRVCARLRIFRPGVRQASGAAVTAGFDAELLFVARRLGARTVEVPVTAAARGDYDRAASVESIAQTALPADAIHAPDDRP
jgi:dolichyl-phosphate beta-glucosyltransferase